nr:DinB family protein [uncultured Chryseobacterium sp.]
MKIPTSQLISELQNITSDNIKFAEDILQITENKLNVRLTESSWSILECIEHLNRYGNFYLPEIENRISVSDKFSTTFFTAGILGNYFTKSMLPDKKFKKMKTFKKMNPVDCPLNKDVLKEFISQQNLLLELLEKSKHVNLNTVKTSVSISTLIKLRLGDTFRFVVYHNLRHIEQAKRVLAGSF